MTSISLTWHIRDDNACPICKAMNNYTWTFEVGRDEMDGTLMHPVYGLVWTLGMGSHAHEHTGMRGECRCTLSYMYDLKDLLEKAKRLRQLLQDAANRLMGYEEAGVGLRRPQIAER